MGSNQKPSYRPPRAAISDKKCSTLLWKRERASFQNFQKSNSTSIGALLELL